MKYHLIVDKAQALWAIQQQVQKQIKQMVEQGLISEKYTDIKVPATLINSLLETVMNSPAYAIQGQDVIYFRGKWPEEYVPMVLNHEELHLLVHRIQLEDGVDPIMASLNSQVVVDSEPCREAISDIFGLNYDDVKEWGREWLFDTLPPVRLVKGIIRRIKNAIQRIH